MTDYKKQGKRNRQSGAEWGEDKSYLLGVIHGDGYVKKDKRGCYELTITAALNCKSYLLVLSKIIYKLYSYRPYLHKRSNVLKLGVYDKRIVKEILPFKTKSKWYLPKGINQRHYLAGLFDTDGHLQYKKDKNNHIKRTIQLSQKDNKNLDIVTKILSELKLSFSRKFWTYTREKTGTTTEDRITILHRDFRNFFLNIPIKNPMKKAILKAIIKHKIKWGNQYVKGRIIK